MPNDNAPPDSHRNGEITGIRKILRISGAIMWVLVCVVGYRMWTSSQSDDSELPQGEYEPDIRFKPPFREYALPKFTLTECRGRTVTDADLLGAPAIICFTFTRCTGQCVAVHDQMVKMQKLVEGADVKLVTITVDPTHDTVDVLKRQAESLQADPHRWWFLTGKQDDIYRLIMDGFQLPVMQAEGENREPGREVAHSDAVLYVNAQGRIVGKYSGINAAEMSSLRRRILRDAESREALQNAPTKPARARKPRSTSAPREQREGNSRG